MANMIIGGKNGNPDKDNTYTDMQGRTCLMGKRFLTKASIGEAEDRCKALIQIGSNASMLKPCGSLKLGRTWRCGGEYTPAQLYNTCANMPLLCKNNQECMRHGMPTPCHWDLYSKKTYPGSSMSYFDKFSKTAMEYGIPHSGRVSVHFKPIINQFRKNNRVLHDTILQKVCDRHGGLDPSQYATCRNAFTTYNRPGTKDNQIFTDNTMMKYCNRYYSSKEPQHSACVTASFTTKDVDNYKKFKRKQFYDYKKRGLLFHLDYGYRASMDQNIYKNAPEVKKLYDDEWRKHCNDVNGGKIKQGKNEGGCDCYILTDDMIKYGFRPDCVNMKCMDPSRYNTYQDSTIMRRTANKSPCKTANICVSNVLANVGEGNAILNNINVVQICSADSKAKNTISKRVKNIIKLDLKEAVLWYQISSIFAEFKINKSLVPTDSSILDKYITMKSDLNKIISTWKWNTDFSALFATIKTILSLKDVSKVTNQNLDQLYGIDFSNPNTSHTTATYLKFKNLIINKSGDLKSMIDMIVDYIPRIKKEIGDYQVARISQIKRLHTLVVSLRSISPSNTLIAIMNNNIESLKVLQLPMSSVNTRVNGWADEVNNEIARLDEKSKSEDIADIVSNIKIIKSYISKLHELKLEKYIDNATSIIGKKYVDMSGVALKLYKTKIADMVTTLKSAIDSSKDHHATHDTITPVIPDHTIPPEHHRAIVPVTPVIPDTPVTPSTPDTPSISPKKSNITYIILILMILLILGGGVGAFMMWKKRKKSQVQISKKSSSSTANT